jgi:hypothetical protein
MRAWRCEILSQKKADFLKLHLGLQEVNDGIGYSGHLPQNRVCCEFHAKYLVAEHKFC